MIVDFIILIKKGYNHEKIWEYLDYAEANDMEGVIVNLDTPYEFKRTRALIKVKKFFDIDLECIGIEPGEKGNTAQGAPKPCIVETGAQVLVPLFVNEGDTLKIDTRTGEYLSRV